MKINDLTKNLYLDLTFESYQKFLQKCSDNEVLEEINSKFFQENNKVDYLKTIFENKNQQIIFRNKKYNNDDFVDQIYSTINGLIKLGLKYGDKVVFVSDNKEKSIFYSLACLSLGIKQIFLYSGYNDFYLNDLISKIEPNKIIVEDKFLFRFKELKNIETSCLYDREKYDQNNKYLIDKNDDLIYMTTSGTTTFPKIIRSGTFENFVILYGQTKILFGNGDNYCLYNNMDFGWGASLMLGAIAVILSGESVFFDDNLMSYNNPNDFNELIEKNNISVAVSAPVFFLRKNNFEEAIDLKKIIFLGDFLKEDVLNTVQKSFKNIKVVNLYGQSEVASGILTSLPLDLNKENLNQFVPMPFLNIYLEDRNLMIERSFKGIMKGFLNDEENFNAYFKNNMYLTKDLAKVNYNGTISLLGRNDGLVKIGGRYADFNLIENEFYKEFCVKMKLVFDEYVFCVIEENVKNFEDFFIKNFGKYVLPKKVIVSKIPLNMNGKVDTMAIKEMFSK